MLSQLTDELFIYHDEDESHSFHPKIYIFEKMGEKAKICIGSSNLTAGGLFTNYEADIELNLDLQAVPNPTSMIPKQSKKQQKNDFIF